MAISSVPRFQYALPQRRLIISFFSMCCQYLFALEFSRISQYRCFSASRSGVKFDLYFGHGQGLKMDAWCLPLRSNVFGRSCGFEVTLRSRTTALGLTESITTYFTVVDSREGSREQFYFSLLSYSPEPLSAATEHHQFLTRHSPWGGHPFHHVFVTP